VCETVETGYDGQYDFDVIQCQSYHEYCASHEPKWTLEDKQRILLADMDFLSSHSDEKVGFIKSGSVELIDDIFNEYKESFDYEIPESMCPICTLSSLSDYNVLAWLLKDSGKTRSEVEVQIRHRFGSLKELREEIK
jgi:hypothetical protein